MGKNMAVQRNWWLKRAYGITPEQYQELTVQQHNKCAICEQPFLEEGTKKGPQVDHDHETKWVRGLLCSKCNTAIGLFNDDPNLMQKAIDYVILNSTPTEFKFEPVPLWERKPTIGSTGKAHTEEWKKQLSLRNMGNKYGVGKVPWNKGLSGYKKKGTHA